jgi:hypothetical protein
LLAIIKPKNISSVPATTQPVISWVKKMAAATAEIIGRRYRKLFVLAAPTLLNDKFQSHRLAPLAISPR